MAQHTYTYTCGCGHTWSQVTKGGEGVACPKCGDSTTLKCKKPKKPKAEESQ